MLQSCLGISSHDVVDAGETHESNLVSQSLPPAGKRLLPLPQTQVDLQLATPPFPGESTSTSQPGRRRRFQILSNWKDKVRYCSFRSLMEISWPRSSVRLDVSLSCRRFHIKTLWGFSAAQQLSGRDLVCSRGFCLTCHWCCLRELSEIFRLLNS